MPTHGVSSRENVLTGVYRYGKISPEIEKGSIQQEKETTR